MKILMKTANLVNLNSKPSQNPKSWRETLHMLIVVVLIFVTVWALVRAIPPNYADYGRDLGALLRNPKIETFESSSQYYEVKISYPILKGRPNEEIAAFTSSRLAEFKDNMSKLSAEDIKTIGLGSNPEHRWTVNIGVTVATSSKYVSYVFEEYVYSGGAHGNTHFYTFTYDATGHRVQLYDLVPGPNYLETISQVVRAKLYSTLADSIYTTKEQVDLGTEPNVENFKSFYPVDRASDASDITSSTTSLTFIFDPYTIGAYVLGSQRVVVDFEK